MKKYDGVYILSDQLKAELIEKTWVGVKADIEKFGGKILSEENVGRRTFVHEMQKQHAGNFFEVVFEMDPSNIRPLRERQKLNEDIFRSMITVAQKRAPVKKTEAPDEQ